MKEKEEMPLQSTFNKLQLENTGKSCETRQGISFFPREMTK